MTATDTTAETLAQAIDRAGSAVELLRNQNWPAFTFPVAPEFTNWRDRERERRPVLIAQQLHRAARAIDRLGECLCCGTGRGHRRPSFVVSEAAVSVGAPCRRVGRQFR